MSIVKLEDRAFLRIGGEECSSFLENIVTCKIEDMAPDELAFGALLTPQGKILFDFFVLKTNEGFLLDVAAHLRDEFAKRLTFYRLRAKVTIEPEDNMDVYACWGDHADEGHKDPRSPDIGGRLYSAAEQDKTAGNYLEHRIACGVPEGGIDFAYGDAYPHEVLMDQNRGVDFKKGCYVGQEVVSRMQHRGTAKKRVIHVEADQGLPVGGSAITADGKPAGTLGSVCGSHGLALLRLDRIAKAETLLADQTAITTNVQEWVNFSMPNETAGADDE